MLKGRKGRTLMGEKARQPEHLKGLSAFSLAGVGIGGVVGAGFLLGSGLTVQQAGPAVVLAFVLGGLVMMQVLESMLIVVFCYSGIGAVAMAGTEAREPKRDIPKATWYMAAGVIFLYVAAMAVLMFITPWSGVDVEKSPFVQAFDSLKLGWASTGMNVIIMIAAFSVMAATYFACMEMLVSLSEAKEAPQICGKKSGPHKRYRIAWLVVGAAGLLIMGMSFVLPPKLFQYLVAASSYFSFVMWALNLLTYLVWLKKREAEETYHSRLVFGRPGAYVTLGAIAVLAGLSLRVADFRMGFYVAAVLLAVISGAYVVWNLKTAGKRV